MSSTDDLEIRTITDAELALFKRQLSRAFGGDPTPKDEGEYDFLKVLDLERIFAAFDGNQIVGTCAAFSLDLGVPGGTLPMGGTTMISVQSLTHLTDLSVALKSGLTSRITWKAYEVVQKTSASPYLRSGLPMDG